MASWRPPIRWGMEPNSDPALPARLDETARARPGRDRRGHRDGRGRCCHADPPRRAHMRRRTSPRRHSPTPRPPASVFSIDRSADPPAGHHHRPRRTPVVVIPSGRRPAEPAGRASLVGRRPADRRIRIDAPGSPYFRYAGPGRLTARPAATAPTRRGRPAGRRGSAAAVRPAARDATRSSRSACQRSRRCPRSRATTSARSPTRRS